MNRERISHLAVALVASVGTASAQDRAAIEAGEALTRNIAQSATARTLEALARCRTYGIYAKASEGTLTRP